MWILKTTGFIPAVPMTVSADARLLSATVSKQAWKSWPNRALQGAIHEIKKSPHLSLSRRLWFPGGDNRLRRETRGDHAASVVARGRGERRRTRRPQNRAPGQS